MSSSGIKGSDGKTYYYDDKTKNATVKDSTGKTVYTGSISQSTPSSSGSSVTSTPSNSTGGYWAERGKAVGINYEDRPEAYKDMTEAQYYNNMSYNIMQAELGRTPTANDITQNMNAYKEYLSKQTNPNDNRVWNQYGEVIGISPTGQGYTDFSYQAANAIVNPVDIWNRNDSTNQRFLTSTPLTGTYKNYDTNTWEEAPKDLQRRPIEFVDYKNLEKMAQEYIDKNPNTLFDVPSLVELWMNKYEDISNLPNYFKTYSKEFEHSGKEPTINPISPGVKFANEEVSVDANGNIVAGVPNAGIVGLNNGIMQNGVNINRNTYMQQMQNLIMQQEQAYIEQQQALLAAERDRQIAELESAYEQAVLDGKLSVREAEEAFETEKKQIQQDYYESVQKLNIYAQNMGIANSQQMIGLMQGDAYRKEQLIGDAKSNYDKRVADIRDRINSIRNQTDLSIANVNSQYNAGVINAIASAQLNSSNQLFNLYQTEYQNQYARQVAIEQALLESQLRIQEMVKQGEITAQQAEVAWEREKERLAIQFGYDVSLANINNAAAAARAAAGRDSDDGYELTLLRKAEQYGIDPNNLPYGATSLSNAIYQHELKLEKEGLISKAVLERTISKEIEKAEEVVAQGKPTPPTKSPLAIKGNYWDMKYQKQMEAYERQLKAYNEGKALLDKYGVKY